MRTILDGLAKEIQYWIQTKKKRRERYSSDRRFYKCALYESAMSLLYMEAAYLICHLALSL